VRISLRARNYLPLVSTDGPVRLDTATAAAVLRWVVDQVDGARARTCQIEPLDLHPDVEEAGVGAPDPIVAIRITLAARSNTRLAPIAAEVRDLVRSVSGELLGLDVTSVDIVVADLYEP
ncbi:MAG TPA: hypothetical protein VGG23_09285, partial [Acidimicrobiales bacterium]